MKKKSLKTVVAAVPLCGEQSENFSYFQSMHCSLFIRNQPAFHHRTKPRYLSRKADENETKAKAKHPILACPPGIVFGRCEMQLGTKLTKASKCSAIQPQLSGTTCLSSWPKTSSECSTDNRIQPQKNQTVCGEENHLQGCSREGYATWFCTEVG